MVRFDSPPKRVRCPLGTGTKAGLPQAACVFVLLLLPSLSYTSPIGSSPPTPVSLLGLRCREVWWEGGMSSDTCLPGWFEGCLRYLELYSEVMKRGPWNTEVSNGGHKVDQHPGGPGGRGSPVYALSRPVWHIRSREGQHCAPDPDLSL